MKNVLAIFLGLTLLAGAKCTTTQYNPPLGELCILSLETGDLICHDPRLEEVEQNYNRDLNKDDFCTNVDDYTSNTSWCMGIAERLEKCELLSKEKYWKWLESEKSLIDTFSKPSSE